MNNPFDYTPDPRCRDAMRQLFRSIENLADSPDSTDALLLKELNAGKMLGVLIASDSAGLQHTLFAFSGQLGASGFHHPRFVGPVFDYLAPDGHFKTKEADISEQNARINHFTTTILNPLKQDFRLKEASLTSTIAAFKENCRLSKEERDRRRSQDNLSEEDKAALIAQSQFEKAELSRLKKRCKASLQPLADRLAEAYRCLSEMKEQRRADSEALQQWLFDNFTLLNARGERRSLSAIFADTSLRIPPSGAGECCAPKLLQSAYLNNWTPLAIAEYWYGAPKEGELRIHGEYYPACRGKCLPVLSWMLRGLPLTPPLSEATAPTVCSAPEIIFENDWMCVVIKPAGMPSVPGKSFSVDLQSYLIERYGKDRNVKVAHRLDRDTSGLIIATFGDEAYRRMQALFARRQVKKTYVALLEGDYQKRGLPKSGRISLPLMPDWLDRPRQRVSLEHGKEALTDYEFIGNAAGRSRILFHPLTGRTHQLRAHAASPLGLGLPIAGDPLYGRHDCKPTTRMMLHSAKIEFISPFADGTLLSFEAPAPF